MSPPAYPSPPPAPRTPWGLIVGITCGGCLILLLLVIGGGVYLFRAGTQAYQKSDPVARKFIQHVFAGEVDPAYSMISRDFMQRFPPDQFHAWVEYCRKSMPGQPVVSFGGYHINDGTGGRRETITYRLSHGDRAGSMQVEIIQENNRTVVMAANFSPGSR